MAEGKSVTGGESVPKWQIALAVGGAVAVVGVGAWYLKGRKSKKSSKSLDKSEKGEDLSVESDDKTPKKPRETVKTKTEEAQGAKNKGNKYFKAGRYDKAIDCYTEAIGLCPAEDKSDVATFYQNRAAAYEHLKNYQKVIDDCTQALSLNKTYTKALFRRAKACEAKGDLKQSLEDITAVCILESFNNNNSLMMADKVLKELGRTKAKEAYKNRKPVEPSPQFIKTYFSAFANDPVMALLEEMTTAPTDGGQAAGEPAPGGTTDVEKHQDETLEKESERIEDGEKADPSPFQKALHALRSRHYADVIEHSSTEINMSTATHVPEALLLRATFYLLRGESNKAVDDLEMLLGLEGVNKRVRVRSNALIKLGSLRMQQGLQKEALADFSRAETEDPENSDIFHHRGQLNLLTEQVAEAVRDFEKSVSLSPQFSVAHVQKCYAVYRQGFATRSPIHMQQAMKEFEDTIGRFPKCAEGYALYGQALCDQQMFDKADENFCKAIDIEPDNGNVYVHRGLLQLQWKQDIEEAARLINKALEVDEKCEFAYETLGTIEIQRGNLDVAVGLFHKSISLAKTEVEMAHMFSLLDAAVAQSSIAQKLGISIPSLSAMPGL